MLWWLLLLVIPLIAHLFNFRKYKRVLFPNTQFLKDVERQTRKTKQLKKYLLLSTRSLLLACLVMAFAIPYCNKEVEQTLPKHFVIVLDNSPSMEKQLETAKNKAREIIKLLKTKDKISLLTYKNQPLTFVDKNDVSNYIDQITISSFGSNIQTIVQQLNELKGSNLLQVFMISDFQKAQFQVDQDSLPNTWLIPVSQENQQNIGIDSAYISNPIGAGEQGYELICLVHNYSDQAIENVPLTVYINNKVVSSSSISIGAAQSKPVDVKFAAGNSNYVQGELRLDQEDLYFDNQLYFTIQNSQTEINVLKLGPTNPFIQAVFKTEERFNYERKSNLPENLKNYNLIIADGFALNDNELNKLRGYVNQGGSVLLIPKNTGDQPDYSILGVSKWQRLEEEIVALSNINFNHPLYRNVYKSIPKNPVEPMIRKHFRISAQGNGQAIFSTANEHPILTENQLGDGKIYQMALPVSKEWSDLPIVGYLFYPTISNIALGSQRSKPLFGWMTGNKNVKPVEINKIRLEGVEQFQLNSGDLAYTAELVNRLGKTFVLPNASMNKAGIYDLKDANSNQTLSKVALNFDRLESKLDFMTAEELTAFANKTSASVYYNELSSHPVLKEQRGIIDTSWKWFIVFALIFVLIEIFLLRFI